MVDATKHMPVTGGTLISDIKSLVSIIRTRRTVVFAYGFVFAFVAFTVFLAFSPSSNSVSPWFANIFSGSSSSSSTSSSSNSNGSQFSNIFSYFFPDNSPPQQQHHNFASPPPQTDTFRSNVTAFQSPNLSNSPPTETNHTQSRVSSDKGKVPNPNQTKVVAPETTVTANHSANLPVDSAPSVNKEAPSVKNLTQSSENANQTTTAAPKAPVAKNQSASPPVKSDSSLKSNSGKEVKGVAGKGEVSNNTTSLSKKQGNGTNSGVSVKQGKDSLVESLMNCDLFDGDWVRDDSYPLYKPGSCSLIDEQFNCISNGRPDKDYQKMRWKPRGCNLPRLDGRRLLDMLRGKRLVFVGDSLNRNMWESLVCILRNSVKDQSKVYEAHGRHHFRGEFSYSFIFKDYDFSVEFFVSPFLVQEWEMPDKNGSKKETLRLDLVGKSSDQYKRADFIIFNTGHWWTHEKTSKGKDYYQEGSHVYGELNVLEAFRKALTTWARWVDANINPSKSLVFFRGYSASHFSGGQWNSGGQCDSETQPIKNETYLRPYPPKMTVLEKVLKGMKTHVTYLNITRMTDFRKDGHPSIYRKRSLTKEERRSPLRFQDCSHWCLPGVPDAWNEVFYAELLVKQHKKQQHEQKRS
ncbi:protein trichome birefringence-like [Corylus avellana]|uniref:protein trichome birefringence-like n=1 Tax=Corylus avellana TaxID=13451 RepID=UPI00286BC252|nr:protein trichome birefringence-like [Corylus avellana]